ncbi:MAG TPA: histidine kinase [Oscillospiraceae bacterium]|mgnify:CR=1 FL=1|nr:histidine kinase [Oscillospiraceae bacterium]HPS35521.1 histidine kinase [Oscillospiraceae bacterium]
MTAGTGTNTKLFNRIFCAAIAFGLFLCALVMLYSLNYHRIKGINGPQNTIAGLTEIDFENGETAYLDGVWKIYDKRFIISDSVKNPEGDRYVIVPSYKDKNSSGESFFYGSYEVTLVTASRKSDLAIYIPNSCVAYKIWLNDQMVGSSGVLGKTAETVVADVGYSTLSFDLTEKINNKLIIEVATRKFGGLYITPRITSYHLLESNNAWDETAAFLISGMLIANAIIFIILRLVVKYRPFTVWFPLSSLFFFVRLLMTQDMFPSYQKVFGSASYENVILASVLASFIFVFSTTMFILGLCEFQRKWVSYGLAGYLAVVYAGSYILSFVSMERFSIILATLFAAVVPITCGVIMVRKGLLNRQTLMPVLLYAFVTLLLGMNGMHLVGWLIFPMRNLGQYLFLALSWYVVIFYALRIRGMYVDSKKLAASETALLKSNATLMLSQIKPHFIYNTLTTIQSMIKLNPDQAYNTTGIFASYLRSNISALDSFEPVLLSKELDNVRSYADIEQIRFGDKLQVIYDINSQGFLLPPLTIQPLVENAIKHGIRKRSGKGTVTVSTREDEDFYYVTVADNGVGFSPENIDSTLSVGLKNIEYRLRTISRGRLEIDSKPGEGTVVRIIIPKEGA